MFTGIIETIGKVVALQKEGANTRFKIESSISHELKIDQSVSHSGVCLTVVGVQDDFIWWLPLTKHCRNLIWAALQIGDKVNLERCMLNNGRFDGHIVQGHVDQTAVLKTLKNANGSWLYTFEYDPATGNVTVEKGSIAVNGVSLTCFDSKASEFTVAIIPYTYENTNFNQLKIGNVVNLEFDVIGKYVKRLLQS